MMRTTRRIWHLGGLVLGISVVAWAQVSMGGTLSMLFQPEALAIVFGGTAAALLVSYPWPILVRAGRAVVELYRHHERDSLEDLVPAFIGYADKARRYGIRAVENEIETAENDFLARALALSVTGLPAETVRQALEIDARVCAESDEERAQVLEAAAGYAPTLGILGAVLGLMQVMERLSGAPGLGSGIAAAFVATIYGVGAANLVFLPLAMRLRARARVDILRRELMIDGVLAVHDGSAPSLVEERLAGYLKRYSTRPQPEAA